jgi:hypothetical protein
MEFSLCVPRIPSIIYIFIYLFQMYSASTTIRKTPRCIFYFFAL